MFEGFEIRDENLKDEEDDRKEDITAATLRKDDLQK